MQEKEMLAVVFALQKWHQFAFGRHVIVRTDHKLREAVTRKRLKYYRAPRQGSKLTGVLLPGACKICLGQLKSLG